jgi:hypothetical protein
MNKVITKSLVSVLAATSMILNACSIEESSVERKPAKQTSGFSSAEKLGSSGKVIDNPSPSSSPTAEPGKKDDKKDDDKKDDDKKDDDKKVVEDDKHVKGDVGQSSTDKTPPTVKPGSGSELCKWFDPKQIDFAEVVPGGPADVAIPITKFRHTGNFESGNFVFTATVYVNRDKVASLDPKNGKKTEYVIMIMDTESSACYALGSLKVAAPRSHGGCFSMTTKIKMADGSEKAIGLLSKGEKVLNPLTGKSQEIVNLIEGPEADKAMYEIGYGSAKVTVTENHPFMTSKGLRAAKNLKNGDLVIDEAGKFVALNVANKLAVNPAQVVRNITLAGDNTEKAHMVLADGIVTGDLYLQKKLEKKSNVASMAAK